MSQRKTSLQRIGAVSGIATPILAFTCILTTIASYPAFSWTNNALSDLGIIPGITGPVFNFGLYSSGLFAFNFAVFGLFTYLGNSWVGKIGALTFVATSVALMGIGVFPENAVPYHYLFSVAFFVLLPISLFVITGAFALKRQTKMALFTLLTAVAAATPWILYFAVHYVSGVAIPEFASAVAGSAWTVVLSYKMFKAASQPKMA
ncbi:DUF998 domain-containing protein [Candidatus Bathyarchaeota archaeon]|nr:DUF998 domain-containing protein [Candidatus Bathyarchaeota archaeon]